MQQFGYNECFAAPWHLARWDSMCVAAERTSPDGANAHMQAYDTLSTSVKKSLYDQCGSYFLTFLRAC
jgi:hypothetical protein